MKVLFILKKKFYVNAKFFLETILCFHFNITFLETLVINLLTYVNCIMHTYYYMFFS